jgi:integrase
VDAQAPPPVVVEPEPEPEPDPVLIIAAYAEGWLRTLTRANPRTCADYERALRRHILAALGELDIAAITPEDIALWLRNQEAGTSGRGVCDSVRAPATKSIANRHALLSTMLETAARLGLRTGNPARGLGPTPKSTHRVMSFLTEAEWHLLHRCLYREDRFPASGA